MPPPVAEGAFYCAITVPLLCHTYEKIPQETARFAKTKNDENPHKQRENPHFCGFFFGGDGGI